MARKNTGSNDSTDIVDRGPRIQHGEQTTETQPLGTEDANTKEATKAADERKLTITPPKIEQVKVAIRGTSPLVICRFSEEAKQQMRDTQTQGSQSRKGKKREPRDFDKCYEQAKYISTDGWLGINAVGFRAGLVACCRLVSFKMTLAKLGIFIVADGYDVYDGTPLVRITKGEPRHVEHYARNSNGGTDLRARPMWNPGWECAVQVQYDSDMFSASEIYNLMHRMGMQNGIGAGRDNSSKSVGQGWGRFELVQE